ncbi:Na/Pi cotransporter family protein [Marinobacter sp. DUT-3]|uniref:Na/Pi cotransporter family protein n=1 Tax=Marinobacter sp. DUT-3 TaxID=3412036 RepID=UPI003D181706
MITTLSILLGGIGLFLLGMILMTDGLKAVAGDALRSLLANFTGSRTKAVATGAGITALVQSSSATTLATIGFVSAGLLTFGNAIGVIIGANLGTTSTGWIVSLLGLKLSIGKVLLPFIGVGAFMRLLGRGWHAHAGSALAGFGVIFVGIDIMQNGMGDLAGQVDLSQYSTAGMQARLMLVLIGAVMTVLMQSSSAAVATTLTALAAGAISVEQAAAVVIGQNVGTTVTAGIAAVGASVPAKRTALVHVVFNLGTGTIAFFILPSFTAGVDLFTERWLGDNQALTIAAFHTAFNLLGAAVFLPLTPSLDWLATRAIPEKRPGLTRNQDLSIREVPSLAVNAAYDSLRQCALITLQNGAARLRGEEGPGIEQALSEVQHATHDTGEFLARLPSVDAPVLGRLTAALHVMDHVTQCARDASLLPAMARLRTMPELRKQADLLAELFMSGAEALSGTISPDPANVAEQLKNTLTSGADARPAILQSAARHTLGIEDALYGLTIQRSLDRLAHDAARALHYLHLLDERTVEAPSLAEMDVRDGG